MSQRHHAASPALAESRDAGSALPAQSCSGRELRAKHLKPDAARVARLARALDHVPQRQLALALDVQADFVARTELDHEPHAYSTLHVASMPQGCELATALVRWQAAKHALDVIKPPIDLFGDDHAARLASVITECTDAPREYAKAIADDHISDDELDTIERESGQAEEAAREMRVFAAREKQRRRDARAKGGA